MIRIITKYLKSIISFVIFLLLVLGGVFYFYKVNNNKNVVEIVITERHELNGFLNDYLNIVINGVVKNNKSYVIKNMEFPQMMEYVGEHDNSIAVSEIAWSQVREKIFKLSNVIVKSKVGILIKKDEVINVSKVVKIGVQNKTTFTILKLKELLKNIYGNVKFEFTYVDSTKSLMKLLKQGTIHGMICNDKFANAFISINTLYKFCTINVNEDIVIACNYNISNALLKSINENIEKYKQTLVEDIKTVGE